MLLTCKQVQKIIFPWPVGEWVCSFTDRQGTRVSKEFEGGMEGKWMSSTLPHHAKRSAPSIKGPLWRSTHAHSFWGVGWSHSHSMHGHLKSSWWQRFAVRQQSKICNWVYCFQVSQKSLHTDMVKDENWIPWSIQKLVAGSHSLAYKFHSNSQLWGNSAKVK